MADVKTTGSDPNLTVAEDSKQESQGESTELTEDEGLPEGSKNWQHAIQLAREREKAMKAELETFRAKLEEKQAEDKTKKLAEMSETERYKSIAEEEAQKRGKLEMRQLILEATADKKIPKPLKDLLLRAPWSIPAVEEELGTEYTWDQAIAAVKRHLPTYLESITAEEETPSTPSEETVKRVDTERSTGATVVKEHFYTKDEIDAISRDPKEYEKHRDKILRQLATQKGRM
jgi:hypothetical protein